MRTCQQLPCGVPCLMSLFERRGGRLGQLLVHCSAWKWQTRSSRPGIGPLPDSRQLPYTGGKKTSGCTVPVAPHFSAHDRDPSVTIRFGPTCCPRSHITTCGRDPSSLNLACCLLPRAFAHAALAAYGAHSSSSFHILVTVSFRDTSASPAKHSASARAGGGGALHPATRPLSSAWCPAPHCTP